MKRGATTLMAQLAGLLARGHRVQFEDCGVGRFEVTVYEVCGPGHWHYGGGSIGEALNRACAAVKAQEATESQEKKT